MAGMSSALKKVMESEEKNKKNYKHQPPDGGWGWVIVASYAVQNMILLPVIINFGLMFRDVFARLKMSTTDSSIIINVNAAAGLLFGLFNGPLLKTFGFRRVACLGSLLTFFGNSMTSQATSFYEFFIYYGIISSIGIALVMASFSLALNTYFVERRGVATGVAMSFTGLGPIFMPLLVSKLMSEFGGRGTALIMAGLTLHSFVGALLLQPVKWHYRKSNVDTELQEITNSNENAKVKITAAEVISENSKESSSKKRRSADVTSLRGTAENSGSIHSLNNINSGKTLSSSDKINEINTSSDEKEVFHDAEEMSDQRIDKYNSYKADDKYKSETEAFIKNNDDKPYHERQKDGSDKPVDARKWKNRIVEIFDLDLLQEPIFRNIWIGMSIAFTAEMNFTLMTPFILRDMGYNTESTARIMSIMGIADLLTRLLSPFIGQKTKLPARYLYLISLFILVIFRFCLTIVDSQTVAVFVFIGLGIGKGFRSIYHSLVVPNHVPLEKLPSASGLQTVLNGIFLMSFGPILGYIKDKIGSYNSYIHVLNILTTITIILWIAEFMIRACKQRNKRT